MPPHINIHLFFTQILSLFTQIVHFVNMLINMT